MHQGVPSPRKAKKKKRSFLEDDDFFSLKKTRKTKSPSASAPSTRLSSPPHTSPSPKKCGPSRSIKAEALSSEQSYYSANEGFSDSGPIDYHSASGEYGGRSAANQEHASAPVPSVSSLGHDYPKHKFPDNHTGPDTPPGGAEESVRGTQIVLTDSDNANEEDDVDSDLKSFFNGISKANDRLIDESSRLYRVKVTSRLGREMELEKLISGNTTFEQLLDQLRRDTLRDSGDPLYWDHGVLVWVEGRSELKPIFRPSTLRIPMDPDNPTTQISCLYIPQEHLPNFEKLYSEFDKALYLDSDADTSEQADIYEVVDEAPLGEQATARKSEYFVIGLKGKDNKRIEAEVCGTTKIRSLLEYYLDVKRIDSSQCKACRLVFDDEELDLDATVGDTELEEDFEVQVYI